MSTEPQIDAADPVPGWQHFDHDADIGIQGTGPTLTAAFEQAGLALTATVTDRNVRPTLRRTITCSAPDIETLLFDWLNALVFEMATNDLLFSRFAVTVSHDSDWRLEADVSGEPIDRERHAPRVEVKGATYTGISVTRDARGCWCARCIVDV